MNRVRIDQAALRRIQQDAERRVQQIYGRKRKPKTAQEPEPERPAGSDEG